MVVQVWSDFLQDYYNYTVHNQAIGGNANQQCTRMTGYHGGDCMPSSKCVCPGSALGAYPTSVLNDSYITIPKHFGRVPSRDDYLLPLPTLMDQVMEYIKQHENTLNKSDIFILEFGGKLRNPPSHIYVGHVGQNRIPAGKSSSLVVE